MTDDLHELLVSSGLGRVADVIVQYARPSIRLTAHAVKNEDALPLGTSKLGGSPDLPLGVEWPRFGDSPLAFIAQINLAKVARYDMERLLPPVGLLYFFFEYEHWYSIRGPEPPDMWRVIFFDGSLSALHRTPMPSPLPEQRDYGPYRPCSLTFVAEMTVPSWLPYLDRSWHSWIRDRIGLVAEFSETDRNAFWEVVKQLQGNAYRIHRMLGHPDPIQAIGLYPEDILLLQIDSKDESAGMMWGDVGRLYWWVKREDLARRDFGDVRFTEECS